MEILFKEAKLNSERAMSKRLIVMKLSIIKMEIKELEGTHQQLGQGQQLGQQIILSSLHLNSLHPSLLFLKMANKMALNINIPKL